MRAGKVYSLNSFAGKEEKMVAAHRGGILF